MGRRHITLDDVPIVIHTALSTATMERVRMFELLTAHQGVLTTSQICESLNTTPPTARSTMTELKATGLVTMDIGDGSAPSSITLKPEFDWFLSLEFLTFKERNSNDLLKEKYPPQKGVHRASSNNNAKKETTDTDVPINPPLYGGKISFNKSKQELQQPSIKPLEQWIPTDFVLNACIHCNNNGGYKGPPITTPKEYEGHIDQQSIQKSQDTQAPQTSNYTDLR